MAKNNLSKEEAANIIRKTLGAANVTRLSNLMGVRSDRTHGLRTEVRQGKFKIEASIREELIETARNGGRKPGVGRFRDGCPNISEDRRRQIAVKSALSQYEFSLKEQAEHFGISESRLSVIRMQARDNLILVPPYIQEILADRTRPSFFSTQSRDRARKRTLNQHLS